MDEGPVVCDIEIHNTDVESPKIVKPFTVVPHPVASETVNSDNDCYSRTAKLSLVRQLPISEGGRIINVFQSCIDDVCSCVHKIGDSPSQLRPCRIGNFLFSNQCSLPNEHVLLSGMEFVMVLKSSTTLIYHRMSARTITLSLVKNSQVKCLAFLTQT